MFKPEYKQQFDQNGYVVAPSVFTPAEVEFYKTHYTTMRESGNVPGDTHIANPASTDPLLKYPRMLQMHRWDQASLNWMLDARINELLTGILSAEPYAVQTMIYFKPPKARGQALHQDNYYLRVQPGTCCAAWMALDDCDEENGCLQVVPGSHNWPVLCTTKADTTQSFTDVTVPIPAGTPTAPVLLKAGDVLFFNGQLVHGSFPNTSATRFRRALIGHYIEGDSQQVARWYKPTLCMDGREIDLPMSEGGSQCGVWVDEHGQPMIEVSGYEVVDRATE
jgi:phytanoyl-CoA hydroxylase